jgi:hypothetical protein
LEIKILQQKGYGIASLNIQIPKEDEGDFHPETGNRVGPGIQRAWGPVRIVARQAESL